MSKTFWAIKHKSVGILCGTSLTRKDAIRGLVEDFGGTNRYNPNLHKEAMRDWRRMKNYSCVKVTVEEQTTT